MSTNEIRQQAHLYTHATASFLDLGTDPLAAIERRRAWAVGTADPESIEETERARAVLDLAAKVAEQPTVEGLAALEAAHERLRLDFAA
jgi:DNA-binding GntR family transcriptional regulator